MSQSAIAGREAKRLETSRRIVHRAVELTRDRGLDGWTMDDLAETAGVSRRTLFNYFPGKIDAVIGPTPCFADEAIATFRAGGPDGRLIDDLCALAGQILDEERGVDLDTVRMRREVLTSNPRLIVIVHERFEQVTGDLAEHIIAREGADFGASRARLLIRLLVAVFDCSMSDLAERPDLAQRPVSEIFDAALADARLLLA